MCDSENIFGRKFNSIQSFMNYIQLFVLFVYYHWYINHRTHVTRTDNQVSYVLFAALSTFV